MTVAGRSTVTSDVREPGQYGGYPLQPLKDAMRTLASLGPLEPGGQVDRLIQALQRAQGRDADAPSPDPAPLQLEFLTSRSAGDVWALWHLWHSLGLEDLSLAWGPQVRHFSARLPAASARSALRIR